MADAKIGQGRSITGRFTTSPDHLLDALQAETAKLGQIAERHRDEIAATTTAFIAEMTKARDAVITRLEALVEAQTDPDGIRAIAAFADRLASSRSAEPAGRKARQPVGFQPHRALPTPPDDDNSGGGS